MEHQIKEALDLLWQRYLEGCYREANQEIDEAFEVTAADGIFTTQVATQLPKV